MAADENSGPEGKQWRIEVAYRTLLLLRTAVAVVQYQSEKVPAWDVPELSGEEYEFCQPSDAIRRHAQTEATVFNDSMRVPLRLAYLLRHTICAQNKRLPVEVGIQKEMKLLGSIDTFLSGYYG